MIKNIYFFLKSYLGIVFSIIGLFVILIFLLRWLSGDTFLVVRLSNYFMAWLGFTLIPMLILMVLYNRAYVAAILLVGLILIGHSYSPLFFNCKSATSANGRSIKIMSYNIWRENNNMIAVAEMIGRVKPDILLLQELKQYHCNSLIQKLKKIYHNNEIQVAYAPHLKQAIMSCYPIQNNEVLFQKGRAQKALIKTPYGLITVINIHNYKRGWFHRHQQMEALLVDNIIPEKGPIILGGDFNTNDQSQTYRFISQFLDNAHWEAGCGFGFTYPSRSIFNGKIQNPAVIRIDHIFYSDHFIPTSAVTLKESRGSDHLPVLAEFYMK